MEREAYFHGYERYIYDVFLILAAVSHLVCVFTNPGTVTAHPFEPAATDADGNALPT
jgi:hypothetical protein